MGNICARKKGWYFGIGHSREKGIRLVLLFQQRFARIPCMLGGRYEAC